MKRNLLCLLGVLSLSAQAQQPPEQPALDAAAREALSQTVRARAADLEQDATASAKDDGTTIIGERESPIGLYITPWRNAFSQQDIDRPPRLLEVNLEPVDPIVLGRQVEYYHALANAKAGSTVDPSAVGPKPATPQ